MKTVVSNLEQIESDAHRDGLDIPHGIQNAIQNWYGWVSEKECA